MMVIIGALNISHCSIQKMIPLWLILFGALLIIKNLSTLIQRIKSIKTRSRTSVNAGQNQSSNTILNVFDSFMALFLIIWFICGNIWIYSNFGHVQYNDSSLETTYCDRLTFLFSFWIITSIYLLLASGCIFFCCTICFTIFLPTDK